LDGIKPEFIHQIITYDRFTPKVLSQSKLWRLQGHSICFFKISNPANDNSQLLKYCEFDLNSLEERVILQETIEPDYHLR